MTGDVNNNDFLVTMVCGGKEVGCIKHQGNILALELMYYKHKQNGHE